MKTAINQSNVVLQGHRNTNDGCWDINLDKTTFSEANVKYPATHSGLYVFKSSSKRKTSHIKKSKKCYSTTKTLDYLPTFNSLNSLFDDNIIDDYKKYDIIPMETNQLQRLQYNKKAILNIIIKKKTVKSELVAFYHGACFSPVNSALIKAIRNGHFITWPGFTEKLIRKYLFTTVATAKGHLNEERQNTQSTKPNDYESTL